MVKLISTLIHVVMMLMIMLMILQLVGPGVWDVRGKEFKKSEKMSNIFWTAPLRE